jgi:ribosomal protein L29
LDNTARIREVRKNIARIQTIITQRKIASQKEAQ